MRCVKYRKKKEIIYKINFIICARIIDRKINLTIKLYFDKIEKPNAEY